MSLLKVAILGTESSGKSTLAAGLAARHRTLWVPEYLREFVDTAGRVPVEADQYPIAAMQRERENAAAPRARKYLFCDTAPLMTAVYSRQYFGGIDRRLAALSATHAQDYGLTLVTAPDIPWVSDGLQRENAAVSARVHRLLLDELTARDIPYRLIAGDPGQRILQVERYL